MMSKFYLKWFKNDQKLLYFIMPSPYNQIEKQKKKKKTKNYFQPPVFFVPKSCGAIIFSCGIISTPLISQIFCVLDKEKELISFFSKQHFQIEKKIYKLISTTQQNQFRGISTKMMEKQKRKKFKKVKIHHQEIAKKNICTRKKVKCIKKKLQQ